MSRPPKYNKEDVDSMLEQFCSDYKKLSSTNFVSDERFSDTGAVYRFYETWEEAINSVKEQHWSDKVQYSKEDLKQSVVDYYKHKGHIKREKFSNDEAYPNDITVINHFRSWPIFLSKAFDEIPNGLVECESCGGYVNSPSMHWRQSNCDFPEISGKLTNALEGILMGDGYVSKPEFNTSNLEVGVINRKYLEYLSEKYSGIFGNVYLSSEEKESMVKGQMYNCRDFWSVSTYHHPIFKKMRQRWYDDGEKVFPKNLKLTPNKLKHWYVTDGGLRWNKDNLKGACIYSENESHRPEFIISLFEEIELDVRVTDGNKFVITSVDKFFSYIGQEELPGFEYKWCIDDRDRYDSLKSNSYGNFRRKEKET